MQYYKATECICRRTQTTLDKPVTVHWPSFPPRQYCSLGLLDMDSYVIFGIRCSNLTQLHHFFFFFFNSLVTQTLLTPHHPGSQGHLHDLRLQAAWIITHVMNKRAFWLNYSTPRILMLLGLNKVTFFFPPFKYALLLMKPMTRVLSLHTQYSLQ